MGNRKFLLRFCDFAKSKMWRPFLGGAFYLCEIRLLAVFREIAKNLLNFGSSAAIFNRPFLGVFNRRILRHRPYYASIFGKAENRQKPVVLV